MALWGDHAFWELRCTQHRGRKRTQCHTKTTISSDFGLASVTPQSKMVIGVTAKQHMRSATNHCDDVCRSAWGSGGWQGDASRAAHVHVSGLQSSTGAHTHRHALFLLIRSTPCTRRRHHWRSMVFCCGEWMWLCVGLGLHLTVHKHSLAWPPNQLLWLNFFQSAAPLVNFVARFCNHHTFETLQLSHCGKSWRG
jgi:hypothetical protein